MFLVGQTVRVRLPEGNLPATVVETKPGSACCLLPDGRSLWLSESEIEDPKKAARAARAAASGVASPAAAPSAAGSATANPYAAPAMTTFPGDRSAGERDWKWMLLNLDGRINRGQYWGWMLRISIAFVAGMMGMAFVGFTQTRTGAPNFGLVAVSVVLCVVGGLALAIGGFCLNVKRWHDRGKSGFWMLIQLIPYIGGLWAFIELGCLPGTPGPNQYGEEPS